MVGVDPFKRPSSALMDLLDNFIFNPNFVHRYLPKIISYLTLVESPTLQFHNTVFVALSSGKVKYILNCELVVILPA